MDYGNLKVPENVTPEVQAILDSYEARNKEIENNHRKNTGRIWLGSALSGASALPVFNIPYVGTGLGGALYELGQGITDGDKLPELAKRTGAGFAIGETVGAIPYAGKYANKLSGGKIGNAFTAGVEKIASTPLGQKVAEIAPKVEDLLLTDIKAFNPNKQTVYHGSPYDFTKFSNEAIGTGEGAQAHGYGHYSALNKGTAEEYAKNLSKGNKVIKYNGKVYKSNDAIDPFDYSYKMLSDVKDEGLESAIESVNDEIFWAKNKLSNTDEEWEKWWQDYLNDLEKKAEKIKTINPDAISEIKPDQGQLYKLSIPKDDVMLREDLPLSKQPNAVRDALLSIARENPNYKLLNTYLKTNQSGKSLLEYLSSDLDAPNIWQDDILEQMGKTPQKISNILSQKGIKGISYNGGIDGEARVIFNPDDIEIVRKFYNQPQAMEYFQKFHPNFGAVVNSIETNPVNTKEWKQYAKNNLIGNSIDVPGYTIVNFTNKNLGKDYPYNMPEYETLLDDLTKSKYAFSTNYNNEADRFYDHLVSDRKGLFDYLIEVIQDTEGNIHHNYKMMKNINRGDKP